MANNDFGGGVWLTLGDVIPSSPQTDPWVIGAVAHHVSFHDNVVRLAGLVVKTGIANGSGWSCLVRSQSCTSDINGAMTLPGTIDITNNQFSDIKTVAGDGQPRSALDLELSYGDHTPQTQTLATIAYTGNTFTGNSTAVNLARTSDATPVTHSGNTFTENQTNYSGTAQPD